MFWINFEQKKIRIFNKAIRIIKLRLNSRLRIQNLCIFNLKTRF